LPVGDEVLTAGGARLSVTAVVLHEQDLTAYNLSIDGIHTYYAGDAAVLVHNCPVAPKGSPLTRPQITQMADRLGYTKTRFYTPNRQPIFTNGKNFISQDVDSHTGGLWKMASKVENFTKQLRDGTYDYDLNWIAP
jgi:hypothetical protein